MTHVLVVRTQTDRLPDITGTHQIGIQVSGAIRASGPFAEDPNTVGPKLLPWNWIAAKGMGDWNPHDATHWRIFVYTLGEQPVELPQDTLSSAVDAPGALPAGLDAAVDERAKDLSSTRRGICLPGGSTNGTVDEISAPTVYGLVESLVGLPHPVPAAKNVFTCVSVDKKILKDAHGIEIDPGTSRFVAFPRAFPKGSDADVDASDPFPTYADPWLTFEAKEDGDQAWNSISYECRASIALDELASTTTSERRLNLADLSVRSSVPDGYSTEDWTGRLPLRIAEAIDPVARVLAVLDDTLRASEGIADPKPMTNIEAGLNKLAARVMFKRFPAGSEFRPDLWSLLHDVAENAKDANHRDAASSQLMAHLGATAASVPDKLAKPLVRRHRLVSALDLPFEDKAVQTFLVDDAGADETLDTAKGFKAFLNNHWFGPTAPSSAPPVLKVFTPTKLVNDQIVDRAGLKDTLLKGDGLPFQVTLEAAPASAAMRFGAIVNGAFKLLREIRVEHSEDMGTPLATLQLAGQSTTPVANDRDSYVIRVGQGEDGRLRAWFDGAADNYVEEPDGKVVVLPADFAIRFPAGNKITTLPTEGLLFDALSARTAPEAARESVALGFAAPYFPGLLAGHAWLNGGKGCEEAAAKPMPIDPGLRERLIDSGGRLMSSILCDVFAPDISTATPLGAFYTSLVVAARENAERLLEQVVPPTPIKDVCPPLTQTATPLTLQIDQARGFAAGQDLWERLSGFGMLLARTNADEKPSGEWLSISAGRIGAQGAKATMFVDPVASLPGDVAGVNQPLVRYDNRWLASAFGGDPQIAKDANSTADVTRRPEAITAPMTSEARLPALSFGYDYHYVPYLVGQGGALPVWLREDQKKPLVRKKEADEKRKNALNLTPKAKVATVPYRRTRPLGTPRLVTPPEGPPVLKALPENLVTLASELAIRPPPLTLRQGTGTCFFRDPTGQAGLISISDPAVREVVTAKEPKVVTECHLDPQTGVSLTMRGIRPGTAKLTVQLFGRKAGETVTRRIGKSFGVQAARGGVRLHILRDVTYESDCTTIKSQGVSVFAGSQTSADGYAEELPEFDVGSTALLSEKGRWDAFFVSVAGTDGAVDIEPPMVTPIEKSLTADGAPEPYFLPVGDPVAPPEAAHPARQTVLVHDFYSDPEKAEKVKFRIRRPSVDFHTFERWINAAFLTRPESPLKKVLDQAYELFITDPRTKRESLDRTENPAKDFDDPATALYHIELVEIFPHYKPVGLPVFLPIRSDDPFGGFQKPKADGSFHLLNPDYLTEITTKTGDTASLLVAGGALTVKAKEGHVYELRVSAVLGDGQDDMPKPLTRLSEGVRDTMRAVKKDGKTLWAGPPQVVTVEAAIKVMPDVFTADWATARDVAELIRPPAARNDTVRLRLSKGLTGKSMYPQMRYVGEVSLYSKRWDWRGRPQAVPGRFASYHGDDQILRDWSEKAFADRRSDDIGAIETRQLDRKFVFDGQSRLAGTRPELSKRPHIFDKALDWHGGMHLRRFALRFTSRYASLPLGGDLVEYTHRKGSGASKWTNVAIPDRPSGRALARPGVSLVLPLTEPLGNSDPTPPLLVLVADRLHHNFNIAEDIEAVVETARHPFPTPTTPPTPKEQRNWPEFGPDPIRSGAGHTGDPVPIRLDGPLGYGFDLGAESGRFDTGGLVLTTAGVNPDPWSMIKLAFRRLEHPEALFDPAITDASTANAKFKTISFSDGVRKVPIGAAANVAGVETTFNALEYDGIAIDLLDGKPAATAALRTLKLSLAENEAPAGLREPVEITYRISDGFLYIELNTDAGYAGSTRFNLKGASNATLRVHVSRRPPPKGQPTWLPAGDAVIKLLVEDDQHNDDQTRGRWLSVATLPILTNPVHTKVPVIAPVVARVSIANGRDITLRPMRMSEFTPGLWCQFTESMSVFDLRAVDRFTGEIREAPTGIEAFIAGIDGTKLTLSCPKFTEGMKSDLSVGSAGVPVESAQIEHAIFAVVSRFGFDAFDKTREIPVAIFRLETAEPSSEANAIVSEISGWIEGEAQTIPPSASGRVRLMKVLAPKARIDGGFAADQFEDFFKLLSNDVDDENPFDASAMVLGISRPVPFGPDLTS